MDTRYVVYLVGRCVVSNGRGARRFCVDAFRARADHFNQQNTEPCQQVFKIIYYV